MILTGQEIIKDKFDKTEKEKMSYTYFGNQNDKNDKGIAEILNLKKLKISSFKYFLL